MRDAIEAVIANEKASGGIEGGKEWADLVDASLLPAALR